MVNSREITVKCIGHHFPLFKSVFNPRLKPCSRRVGCCGFQYEHIYIFGKHRLCFIKAGIFHDNLRIWRSFLYLFLFINYKVLFGIVGWCGVIWCGISNYFIIISHHGYTYMNTCRTQSWNLPTSNPFVYWRKCHFFSFPSQPLFLPPVTLHFSLLSHSSWR